MAIFGKFIQTTRCANLVERDVMLIDLAYLSITEVKYFSAAECSPVYNSLHGCGEDEGDLHLAADPVFCLSSDVVEVGGGGLKNFAAPDGAALW